jgi:hypothetical protein
MMQRVERNGDKHEPAGLKVGRGHSDPPQSGRI